MTKRQLFGTDGIRGRANVYPMTCEVAMNLGRAVTYHFQLQHKKDRRPLIILGKDTRLSCYMLELAFSAGVCAQGGKVILTGPLPTPGIAFATRSMRANAGVMISASHNKYSDNGIKIFDESGSKLPDEVELELEKLVLDPNKIPHREGRWLGNARRLDEVLGRYIVHVKSHFEREFDLSGMRVILDCANGAGYKVAPMIFEELGAEVFCNGVQPTGQNINLDCGSMFPHLTSEDVVKYKADIGIALDGDADRVILVNNKGGVINGDRLIGLFAKMMLDRGEISKGDEIVGTVMSNLGLENFIKSLGLKFYRSKVGDRYISRRMKESGSKLGGEPSGHIILGQYHGATGDGILAALKAIECMKYYDQTIKQLVKSIKIYPQIINNINVKTKTPLEQNGTIQSAIKDAENTLGEKGRVLLRYSGTESLLRVMVEGEHNNSVKKVCETLSEVVRTELN